MVQSFVHGANCALAHLHFEAVLIPSNSHASPQAGRPFCITDPNPPIYYGDLYSLLSRLATTPFKLISLPPMPFVLVSYFVEFWSLLPYRLPPWVGRLVPELRGDIKHLQPGLFSICTHLVADYEGADARRAVGDGGLGYEGVMSTLEGMCQELVEWNREQEEHAAEQKATAVVDGGDGKKGGVRYFHSSVSLAEQMQRVGLVGKNVKI